jgi:hypothetical protein
MLCFFLFNLTATCRGGCGCANETESAARPAARSRCWPCCPSAFRALHRSLALGAATHCDCGPCCCKCNCCNRCTNTNSTSYRMVISIEPASSPHELRVLQRKPREQHPPLGLWALPLSQRRRLTKWPLAQDPAAAVAAAAVKRSQKQSPRLLLLARLLAETRMKDRRGPRAAAARAPHAAVAD